MNWLNSSYTCPICREAHKKASDIKKDFIIDGLINDLQAVCSFEGKYIYIIIK
jgi:hypothetical protein